MINFFLLLNTLIFLSASCSYLATPEEELISKARPVSIPEQLYCPQASSLQLIGEFKNHNQEFLQILKVIESNHGKLIFTEKLILLGLYQIYVRPDSNSPFAHAQIALTSTSQDLYMDFRPNTGENPSIPVMPYMTALKELSLITKSGRSLSTLSNYLERYTPTRILVSPALEDFFTLYSAEIKASSELQKNFMKGDDLLKSFERMNRPSLTKLIQLYQQYEGKEKLFFSQHLFNYQLKSRPELSIRCNLDLGLYDQSILLIEPNIPQSNIVGLSENGQTGFIISSQSFYQLSPKMIAGVLRGNARTNGQAVCWLSNPNPTELNKILLVSTQERDPGQHLHHFLKRKKLSLQNVSGLTQDLFGPRYLFLSNPLRLSYESELGSRDDLASILKLSIPVYHSSKLGNIWGSVSSSNKDNFLFLDQRNRGEILCKKE